MSITKEILISGKRGHRTCVYILWVIVFHPWAEKKCTSVFCVNVWLLLRWKPVMFLQTARGQNNYQITPICANLCFHERIAGCLHNGRYKRGRKRGQKNSEQERKRLEAKKDMKLQGRETGPRWCVWLEQSGSDSSSGHFRGFHPKKMFSALCNFARIGNLYFE